MYVFEMRLGVVVLCSDCILLLLEIMFYCIDY